MQFEGALVTEQGITFGIVIVKAGVLQSPQSKASVQRFGKRAWGNVPVILMAQDPRGLPTYHGRDDIVRFLVNIDMSRIPWKSWSLN